MSNATKDVQLLSRLTMQHQHIYFKILVYLLIDVWCFYYTKLYIQQDAKRKQI